MIRANGIDIHYKLLGSGPPLLLIMGIGSTMERWRPDFLEALSSHYQLILFDNRGVGGSTADEKPFSYKLFAEDCACLLDSLQIPKAHVYGVSMGGCIAQAMLLYFPEKVDKAILCASHIGTGDLNIETVRSKLPPNPTAQKQLEAGIQWKTPLEKMARISHPVLIITGTADTIVDPKSAHTLAAAIPGAWLACFKNGGHLLMDQAALELAKTILAFLDIKQVI